MSFHTTMHVKKLVFSLLVTAVVTSLLHVYGQVQNKYDLLTERYVERPVAVHAGQLQVNSGYEFSIINKKFDYSGNSLDLSEEGIVSARHLIPLEIKFGVIEFLQVRTKINYASQVIRYQENHFVAGNGIIYSKEIETTKGLDDLTACIDLTAPFQSERINWMVTAGIVIPLFDHKPEKPDHEVEFLEPYPGSMDISYHYLSKFGRGIPFGILGTSLKIRLQKLAVESHIRLERGLKKGESIYWDSRLINKELEYRAVSYDYEPGQPIDFGGTVAYQAIDWLVLFASYGGMQSTGGWTTMTGKKVALPSLTLHTVAAGYEIQVSPALRLKQLLYLPVGGKNILAPWIFETGVGFNFITY